MSKYHNDEYMIELTDSVIDFALANEMKIDMALALITDEVNSYALNFITENFIQDCLDSMTKEEAQNYITKYATYSSDIIITKI